MLTITESRHNDTIVVRDPQTQQLVLRGATPSFTDCPTCHRPFRSSSPERQTSPHRSPHRTTPFISPEYFRMLQNANSQNDEHNPPSSPIRRLVEPAFSSPASTTGGSVPNAEFVASSPAPQAGHSIKKEAFSPNYFKRFFIEEKELGRGGKGVVLLVRHELDRVSLGQFACKRVPVGDDHAWLEKGNFWFVERAAIANSPSSHRSTTSTGLISPELGLISTCLARRCSAEPIQPFGTMRFHTTTVLQLGRSLTLHCWANTHYAKYKRAAERTNAKKISRRFRQTWPFRP